MGLFNLFKTKSETQSQFSELQSETILNLSILILKSSLKIADTNKNELVELWKSKNVSAEEENTIWFSMLIESLYCHLKWSDRMAFSLLGQQKRTALMNVLVPTLQYSLIESVFNGWDEKSKEKLKRTFADGYNESQLRYSKSKDLIDKKNPFLGNGILSILGRQIADINNSSLNPEIILRAIELTSTSLSEINFEKQIGSLR